MRVCFIALALLGSCAQPSLSPVARIAGIYSLHDVTWSRTLELHQDGGFSFYQLSKFGSRNAKIMSDDNWGINGSWEFHPPDRVELVSLSRAARASLFVRFEADGGVGITGIDEFANSARDWDVAPAVSR